MRMPLSTQPFRIDVSSALFALTLLVLTAPAQDLASSSPFTTAQQLAHQSDQWAEVEKHLPDPHTASPQALEQQADILRARRFPEDAMDYYKYALDRGGNPPALLNKLGLAELEMHHIQLARVYFQRVVKARPQERRGLEQPRRVRVHGRLATPPHSPTTSAPSSSAVATPFSTPTSPTPISSPRTIAARATRWPPRSSSIPTSSSRWAPGGIAAHVLSARDQARFSFEMAKMYAHSGMEDELLHALSRSAEAGMDVQLEMAHDPVLAKYQMDPRVVVLVRNAELLRATRTPTISATGPASSNSTPARPLAE